jgi:hypothetical protein
MSGDWFEGAGNGSAVDVVKMLDGLAGDGVAELVASGALVSMGTTSDGGALGVTVTVDGRWRREYFRDEEMLCAWIAEAIPAVKAARAASPSSSVSGNGSRRRKGL